MDPRLATLIYGSCVSRDLTRIDAARFSPGHYTARQSWISAYSPPVSTVPQIDLRSSFQRKMVEDDFRSSGKDVLRSTRPADYDVILLDLVDERLGVLPYGSSFITCSSELRASGAVARSRIDQGLIPFGSDAHFELWRTAANRVRDALDPWLAKTYVLGVEFVSEDQLGNQVPRFRDESAAVWNSRYKRYYAELLALGFTVLEHPAQARLSSTEHIWGTAPFHYVDDAYLRFADEVIRELGGKAAT